jgi:hypothetical protein
MPNNQLWQTTIEGEELRQRQSEIDKCMRDTIRHRPYSPILSGEPAKPTEEQILASCLDGVVSEQAARQLKAKIKQLPDEVRAALLPRLGWMSPQEIRDALTDAEGGSLSREEREEWERKSRTIKLC